MSIMIVRGPLAATQLIRAPLPLPREVIGALVGRTADAGRALSLRTCGSEQELLDALRVAQQAGIEAAILDAGACADSNRVRRQMQALAVPYVQVHGARPDGMPPRALAGAAASPPRCIAEVHGYGAQGYLLALAIALDHLGCGEHANPVHVGT